MDDGITVEVIEIGHDPGLEFGFGCDADMAKHRARHLGKEALDKIEPGAVFGGKHQAESSLRLRFDQALVSLETWAE